MAQEKHQPEMTTSAPEDLTFEGVRTAIAHIVEVAAAFEQRGLDFFEEDEALLGQLGWPDKKRERVDERDRAFLKQVVDLALQHRKEQRRQQRDALLGRLAIELVPPIKAYSDAARAETRRIETSKRRRDEAAVKAAVTLLRAAAQAQVRGILLGFFIDADARALDRLVPEPHKLKDLGYPAQAIEERLGECANLGQRQTHDIKKTPHVLDDARFAFGRWVPRNASARYVKEIFDQIPSKTESARFRCDDLDGLAECLGLLQDRRVENIVATLLSDRSLLAAWFRSGIVESAKSGAEPPPGLAPEGRALVAACVEAERAGDRDAARRAARELEKALLPEAAYHAEQLRPFAEEILGPFDVMPPPPAGATGPAADIKASLRQILDFPFSGEPAPSD